MATPISPIAEELRRQDWERFICALFAPAAFRNDLFALLAFNLEVARTREVVSEPMLGEIRLQWWADRIAEIYDDPVSLPAGNPVLSALAETVSRHQLPRQPFEKLVEARRADLYDEAPEHLPALETYARLTAGGLWRLQFHLAGAGVETGDGVHIAAAESAGIAWTVAGLLRTLGPLADAGRNLIPANIQVRHGIGELDFRQRQSTAGLQAAAAELANHGRDHISRVRGLRRSLPPGLRPLLLPLSLADGYLGRLAKAKYDPFAHGLETGRVSRQLHVLFNAVRRGY